VVRAPFAFSAIAGSRVKRGEVVGYTGISGRSTGPHVHYEVRMNNAPINPWRYMKSLPLATNSRLKFCK